MQVLFIVRVFAAPATYVISILHCISTVKHGWNVHEGTLIPVQFEKLHLQIYLTHQSYLPRYVQRNLVKQKTQRQAKSVLFRKVLFNDSTFGWKQHLKIKGSWCCCLVWVVNFCLSNFSWWGSTPTPTCVCPFQLQFCLKVIYTHWNDELSSLSAD